LAWLVSVKLYDLLFFFLDRQCQRFLRGQWHQFHVVVIRRCRQDHSQGYSPVGTGYTPTVRKYIQVILHLRANSGEQGYVAFLGDPFGLYAVSGSLVLSTAAVREPAMWMLSTIGLVCVVAVLGGRRVARIS
jgi:hypothetical protein